MSGDVSDETAQRIGQKLGAQSIISGSFVRIGGEYRMRIRAIAVETAQVQGLTSIQVKMDKTLRGLVQEPSSSGNDNVFDSLNDKNRLYLGAKAGISIGNYDNGGGLADKAVYPSQSLKGIISIDASLFVSIPIWSLFALQTEALLTNDSFDLFSGNNALMTASYRSLMIPLLAKLVWRPSIFMIQGYAGPYLSLPIGQMELKHRNGSYSADIPLMFGYMAGGGGGIKLGPGSIIMDIRYAADFGDVTINYNGNKDISHRGKVFFALGYEFSLLPKK